jgi:rod shape determining protein RodA
MAMARIDRRSVQNFDWVLAGVALFLLVIGFGNLYSATVAGTSGGFPAEMKRQLAALGLGMGALVVAVLVDYRHLERLAFPLYVATLGVLAATLVFAPVTRGSQAWLVFGPVRFQPSELAKVAMVVALARVLHRQAGAGIRSWRDIAIPAAVAAGPVALILLQRDMGVAMLTLLVACTYLPFLRIPLRAWAAMAAAGAAALAGIWFFALAGYQRSRILDFLDPARDPLASGYQAIQSRIAVGSGGLFGKGWLEGTQTQLRFLPTQHTDFIFSVFAEEWGLFGSGIILAVYLFMLLWGLWIASNSKDAFGGLLAVGLVGTLFWPAAINVAMVLGLAPVIGVPLPLFSYGGSAMIAALISIGLLLNVSMRRYMF